MDGTVKRVPEGKDFGFILGTDNVERFFHRSQLRNAAWPIPSGVRVTFDPDKGPKGDRAVNINLVA
jgi:cold shock CspA family protein